MCICVWGSTAPAQVFHWSMRRTCEAAAQSQQRFWDSSMYFSRWAWICILRDETGLALLESLQENSIQLKEIQRKPHQLSAASIAMFFFLAFQGICPNAFCQSACPSLIHLSKEKMFAMWCNYMGKGKPWSILKKEFLNIFSYRIHLVVVEWILSRLCSRKYILFVCWK